MNKSHSETDEIRGEIERTRIEMKDTIGEIQDRLRPDHLLQQARDGVKEAAVGKAKTIMSSASETAYGAAQRARGYGNHLAWYAKEHPIRMAVTAGVITWLCMRNRSSSSEQFFGASDTTWDQDEYLPVEPSLRDRVGEVASSARETVGDYAASAKETVNDYAQSAASSARAASLRARSAASRATTTVDDFVHENPLAAGAIAVALGAAIGLAVRSTKYEDRAMGSTRDQAMAKAKNVASNITQNVTDKVATYAENVVDESLTRAAAEPPMGRA
jgi:ElaB/YqjD/DUF883 family membrane-anchored ribosome-binding protein